MGYTGSVVMVRHIGDVLDLESIGERSQGVFEVVEYAGGWQLAWFDDDEIDDEDETLAEITAESGAGCLVFVVLDSSSAILGAHSAQTGVVRAALSRDTVLEELEEVVDDPAAQYPPPAVAAPGLVAWARALGLEPDAAEVERQLHREPDLFVNDVMDDLLAALGFTQP